jgi:hypothetical protein
MADKKMGPKEILSGGGEKKKGPEKKGKGKHGFGETRIKHHKNGSHTVTHTPESDGTSPPGPETSYAVKDMDELHDGLEEHLGEPNADEEAAAAGPVSAPPSQGA